MTIAQLFFAIAGACMAAAFFGCLYTVYAAVFALRFGRDDRGDAKPHPPVPVTILVPLCGHEPGLDLRLRALATQDYAAPVQVLCGVRDAADPAAAVVDRLAAELPAIALHADPRLHGRNLKISNLMNMIAQARHDTFAMLDSDIAVGPDYLTRVVGALQKPGVGAVTCFYTGVAKGGFWARLAAMDINLQFLSNAIVALRLGLGRPCFGATIALTRDTLDKIGGLARFADQLWDDYAIGQAVRAAGDRVAVPSLTVAHVCTDRSARELFVRALRVERTIGNIDPVGHAGAVITDPFALALLAVLFGGGAPAAVLSIAALACRAAMAWCIGRRFGTSGQPYWLLPLRDLAAFAVYVLGFLGGTVVWRGHRYRIDSDGTLLGAPH
jgi:ceramide glucosyltransferase